MKTQETMINDFESLFNAFFVPCDENSDYIADASLSLLESKIGEVGIAGEDTEYINKIKKALELSDNKAEKVLILIAAFDKCEYIMAGSSKVNKDEVFTFLREYSDCAKFISFVNKASNRVKEDIKKAKDSIREEAEKKYNELSF